MPDCRHCPNKAISLAAEVAFCWRCGRGWSSEGYDASIYGEEYAAAYAGRGDTELGKRINLARMGLVATFLPIGARLLDVGCGSGDFLRVARLAWKCAGAEANAESAEVASSRSGCRVEASVGAFAGEEFDAACMFDSLEHFESPEGALAGVSAMLAPAGLLFISIPELPECFSVTTSEPYLSKLFGEWRHAKREHLSYWTFEGLRRFLEAGGFSVAHFGHNESFLRVDPKNVERNILTIVAVKK